MAKERKKLIRTAFNAVCLTRDFWVCKVCPETADLEVHHITNRNDMPNGGYVKANGITLCPYHHEQAEEGYWTEEDLYLMIDSSYEEAYKASERL